MTIYFSLTWERLAYLNFMILTYQLKNFFIYICRILFSLFYRCELILCRYIWQYKALRVASILFTTTFKHFRVFLFIQNTLWSHRTQGLIKIFIGKFIRNFFSRWINFSQFMLDKFFYNLLSEHNFKEWWARLFIITS